MDVWPITARGLIDRIRAARTEHLRDAIMRNALACHKGNPELMGLSWFALGGRSTRPRANQSSRFRHTFHPQKGGSLAMGATLSMSGRLKFAIIAGIAVIALWGSEADSQTDVVDPAKNNTLR